MLPSDRDAATFMISCNTTINQPGKQTRQISINERLKDLKKNSEEASEGLPPPGGPRDLMGFSRTLSCPRIASEEEGRRVSFYPWVRTECRRRRCSIEERSRWTEEEEETTV